MAAFVDTNIPTFAGGKPHPLREPCRRVLASALTSDVCVSSAEVLQELLNLYSRRGEPARASDAVADFDRILRGRIESVLRDDVLDAARMTGTPRLQARDRVHLAVMARLGITDIISTDSGFDTVPGVRRLDPMAFASWRDEVFGTGR
ncbi:MAG: type II toxin-antitoxin system VapC family toxin [Dehalococcoidia bacterium]